MAYHNLEQVYEPRLEPVSSGYLGTLCGQIDPGRGVLSLGSTPGKFTDIAIAYLLQIVLML